VERLFQASEILIAKQFNLLQTIAKIKPINGKSKSLKKMLKDA
jgi:hypothetical protein